MMTTLWIVDYTLMLAVIWLWRSRAAERRLTAALKAANGEKDAALQKLLNDVHTQNAYVPAAEAAAYYRDLSSMPVNVTADALTHREKGSKS